jgi:hypothetical protein
MGLVGMSACPAGITRKRRVKMGPWVALYVFSSFNPYNNPVRYYYTHSTDEKTKTQKVNCLRPKDY